jgi:hypothetical protein
VKNRPGATWWDIADELDVFICDNGPSGCQSQLTPWAHKKGTVKDNIVHWVGFNNIAGTKGLRQFLIWCAYAKNPEFLEEPDWLGLYHADRWAFHTEIDVFSLRLSWELTARHRKEVKRRARKAHVSLRQDHHPVWWWANWKPERAKMRTPVRGSLNG